MAIEVEGQVGPTRNTDGSNMTFRQAKTGEQVVSDVHARYYEATSRGSVYSASMQAGASLGTALTATGVTLTLYNPANSGYNICLLEVGVQVTTFLTASGSTVYALAGNVITATAAPSATTAATVRCTYLGNAAGVGLAYTTATLPNTPILLRSIGTITYVSNAGGLSLGGYSFMDMTDGKVVLAPNTCVTLQGIGIASSGIVHMVWEEVPII